MHISHFRKLLINYLSQFLYGPGGGIGRRKGLKIPREQSRAGSTPALGRQDILLSVYMIVVLWYLYI